MLTCESPRRISCYKIFLRDKQILSMKNIQFTFFILLTLTSYTTTLAQNGLGGSFAVSSEKVFSIDLFYGYENNRFHLGYAEQPRGTKNTVVTERPANYGLTKIEDGQYISLFDLGYSRVIVQKITVHGEMSIGRTNYFTSYVDNRFSDGGYSLIKRTEGLAGIGTNIGFLIKENIEPFIGYHTLKGYNFGIRFIYYLNM